MAEAPRLFRPATPPRAAKTFRIWRAVSCTRPRAKASREDRLGAEKPQVIVELDRELPGGRGRAREAREFALPARGEETGTVGGEATTIPECQGRSRA